MPKLAYLREQKIEKIDLKWVVGSKEKQIEIILSISSILITELKANTVKWKYFGEGKIDPVAKALKSNFDTIKLIVVF